MSFNNEQNIRGQSVPNIEKGYSGELAVLGKLAYFMEYFDGEKLEEQDIKIIIPLENPCELPSYKEGYSRAVALVRQGFTKSNYIDFLKNMRKRLKDKLEIIAETKNKGHR